MRFCIAFASLIACLALNSLFTSANSIQGKNEVKADKVLVCYFGSWAKYRPGAGFFDVESIDPQLCTHAIFGFAGLRAGAHTIYALDEYNDLEENWGRGAYKRFTNLKQQNPRLKTLLAIGGWNEASGKYSEMAENAANRRTFINSVVPFLQTHGFDGLDLDWEYPAGEGCCGGGRPQDKENFALLCDEMREEFDKHGWLLTAAVAAGESTIAAGYDIPRISRSLDFINIMAYDMHGAWEDFTHHHTALEALPTEFGDNAKLNVKHAINFWISQGAPASKLILGMGTYGRGWTLDSPDANGIYAPARQGIPAGPYTREAGIWGYNEVCERFRNDGSQWTVVRPDHIQSPYAYNGNLWIGYDDIESITVKSVWAMEMGLGGGMFWSVETDDFLGTCGGEQNPLMKTAYRIIIGGDIPEPTTTTSTTPDPTAPTTSTTTATTTTSTTTTTPPPDGECQSEGINGERCSPTFFSCTWQNGEWVKYHFNCNPPLLFDPAIKSCNYPEVIGC